MHPLVSVILINYNSSDYTLNCVRSIQQFTPAHQPYEIIIVDNNSTPEELAKLLSVPEDERIRVVRSMQNLGFAGGNAYGVQFARGDYFFFLNNDCLLLHDAIGRFVEFCKDNPRTGICSCYTLSESGEIQYNYSHFPTLSSKIFGVSVSRWFNTVYYPPKSPNNKQPLQVDLAGGSVLFVNAAHYRAIGGFDTTYFLYSEEEDLAKRMNDAGYTVMILPEGLILHLGSKSTGKSLPIQKEFYISFLYFYRKHYGWLRTKCLQLYLFIKLARKFYKDNNGKLALFIISGAHLGNSLRHRQKLGSH